MQYELSPSKPLTSKSFPLGVLVLCPSATNRDFILKFSPILTSNIVRNVIFWYPGGNSGMSFYQTSKAGLIFFIYFHMASHQRVLTFYSSNDFSYCNDLGILTPELCLQNQLFDFNFPMMQFCFASTYRIHHANSGSPAIRRCTTYSAICTWYEFFISLKVTHVVLPSFHWTRN